MKTKRRYSDRDLSEYTYKTERGPERACSQEYSRRTAKRKRRFYLITDALTIISLIVLFFAGCLKAGQLLSDIARAHAPEEVIIYEESAPPFADQ